jgi:tRNA G18 (ribose-2'-O)-methylase SpoU
MQRITHVDSLEVADLQPYVTLRRAADHVKQGIFVAEGSKVVQRLLETNIEVVSLLLTEDWLENLKPFLDRRVGPPGRIWLATKGLLESIVGFDLHQGVMAVAKIPEPVSLQSRMRRIGSPHLLVALDGLTNADNIGVIVRNCAAFGVDSLIVPQNCSSPYLRRAVRMSMGAIFKVPVCIVGALQRALKELKTKFGTRLVAADPSGALSIEEANLRGNLCLVLGSEGGGISDEVLEMCIDRISVPMTDTTDSLNVATASGIFLFEARRQRMNRLRGRPQGTIDNGEP